MFDRLHEYFNCLRCGSCEPLKTVTIERHGSRPLWAVAVRQANGGRRPSVGGTNDRHVRRQRRPTTQFCLADNSFELHVATAPVTDVLAPQGCEATHLAGMAGKGPARGPIRPNGISSHGITKPLWTSMLADTALGNRIPVSQFSHGIPWECE